MKLNYISTTLSNNLCWRFDNKKNHFYQHIPCDAFKKQRFHPVSDQGRK
jgi:hypothetical protein